MKLGETMRVIFTSQHVGGEGCSEPALASLIESGENSEEHSSEEEEKAKVCLDGSRLWQAIELGPPPGAPSPRDG